MASEDRSSIMYLFPEKSSPKNPLCASCNLSQIYIIKLITYISHSKKDIGLISYIFLSLSKKDFLTIQILIAFSWDWF